MTTELLSLKSKINEDMKLAMKAKDAPRLSTIRLILTAVKQKEVDERVVVSDADLLVILDKMAKQRRAFSGVHAALTRWPALDIPGNDSILQIAVTPTRNRKWLIALSLVLLGGRIWWIKNNSNCL